MRVRGTAPALETYTSSTTAPANPRGAALTARCPRELHNRRWSLDLNAAPRRADFSPVQGLPKRQVADQQFDQGLPQSDVLRFEDRQETYRPALMPGTVLLL
jgi:hypothetical protein